jgi:hypothetical protein
MRGKLPWQGCAERVYFSRPFSKSQVRRPGAKGQGVCYM